MNEPYEIDADAWARIAKQTLAATRSTGSRNIVLIPGTNWDGAHGWMATVGNVSNAGALLTLARDDDRVVFEVHRYFDDDFSGTSTTCGAAGQVPAVLTRVADWARAHRVRAMLGKFGVSQRPEGILALDAALRVVERERDVWYGWTDRAAGAWWGDDSFNIQPSNGDTLQGAALQSRAAALCRITCTSAS